MRRRSQLCLETLTVQGYRSKDLLLHGVNLPRVSPNARRSWAEISTLLRLLGPEVRTCGDLVTAVSFDFFATLVLNIGWLRTRQSIVNGLKKSA